MISFFVLAILMFIMPVFAEEAPVSRIFVYPDVLEYAINKNFSVLDRDRVAQEWENRMDSNGMVTQDDIWAVCKVGRIDDTKCNAFQKDLMTYFYDVCEKSAGKGKSDCVKDFWAAAWGTWVRLPEAIGIAKEYALVKNKETVVCSTNVRNVNPPARASYVKCTSVDGGHYYTYKYNSTTETNDRDILSGTLRAVGKIHDIEFQNADCSLERIYSDSNCALSYKTSDGGQCEKINKSLNRFGYSAKVVNTDKFGKRCEVFGLSGGNRTAYGIDNTVFKDVQYVAGPEVEKQIKAYVQKELNRQNVKLQTFKCDSSTKHIYNTTMLDGLIKEHSEVLTCYVNGSPIDFLFKDLSESSDRAKEVGLSKMVCAQIGGKVDGRDCRGLDENECIRISYKIPGGTRWDDKAEVCILNKVDIDKKINDRIQILGGLVLAVGIGAVIAPEVAAATGISETSFILLSGVGSVVTDEGFIQIERLEELKPAKYAHEFVSDALMCGIPTGTTRCNRTEVECAMGVVSKHFGRLDEIIDKLNDSQLQSVVEAMINVTDCLDKDQFATALNTMTVSTNIKDKIVNNAGVLWLVAGMFVSPENTVTKLAARAPRIARVLSRCRIVERVSDTLDGAKYIRIYVDNLDISDIKNIVGELQSKGMYVSSNMTKDGRRFVGVADRNVFGKWNNIESNWLFGGAVIDEGGRIGQSLYDALLGYGIKPSHVGRGFFQVNIRSGDQCLTGLKFHVSVSPEDLERVTLIVNDLVKRTDVADIWKVGLNGMGGDQLGKDFTIYVSQSGYNSRKIQSFLNELESSLRQNNIRPNGFGSHVTSGDRAVSGSYYMNYRYDRTNKFGIPDGKYNDDYIFVVPRREYGGDMMDGIRVR